jgi:hypothetical protein
LGLTGGKARDPDYGWLILIDHRFNQLKIIYICQKITGICQSAIWPLLAGPIPEKHGQDVISLTRQ